MTGQDAVNSAKEFNEALELDGVDPDQARRRRPRRRRAVGQGRHRQADQVHRRRARSSTRSRSSTPTAWPAASSAWATSSRLVEKAQRAGRRRARREELQRKMRKGEFTLEDFREQMQQMQEDGPARQVAARHDPRRRRARSKQADAAVGRASQAARGDHRLDDAAGAARPRHHQRQRGASASPAAAARPSRR